MQTVPWKERVAEHAGGATFMVPEPEPARSRVWFFTRKGGVSEPPYDSLNISTVVGDGREAVAENLSRIKTDMRERPSAWVRQVAGDGVVEVDGAGFAGEGDALVAGAGGFSLVVAVADCVPVALVGEGTVGMVHSGWRGTLSGIGGKAAREVNGGAPCSVRAFIGPGIRGCCYEVSEELAERFAGRFGPGGVSGRYLSLPGAIRRNLEEIQDLGPCTGCRTALFYAHRKEGPETGRNLAALASR